jgi:hypothetical protein
MGIRQLHLLVLFKKGVSLKCIFYQGKEWYIGKKQHKEDRLDFYFTYVLRGEYARNE